MYTLWMITLLAISFSIISERKDLEVTCQERTRITYESGRRSKRREPILPYEGRCNNFRWYNRNGKTLYIHSSQRNKVSNSLSRIYMVQQTFFAYLTTKPYFFPRETFSGFKYSFNLLFRLKRVLFFTIILNYLSVREDESRLEFQSDGCISCLESCVF